MRVSWNCVSIRHVHVYVSVCVCVVVYAHVRISSTFNLCPPTILTGV
jgi:hypothetical protein